MDSMHVDNNKESMEDESVEQLLSPFLSNLSDSFGDPQVHPRVGDQYQAELPHLIAECGRLQLVKKPPNSELAPLTSFSLGLAIPLMWVESEKGNNYDTVKFTNSEESQGIPNNENAESNTMSDGRKDAGEHIYEQPTSAGSDKMEIDLIIPQKLESKQGYLKRSSCALPGYLGESWGDVEPDSFLLGLYIFGKNLKPVRKFVGSKAMGDILSFYYGNFYRSDEYHRWSDCRRLKNRRCVHGQKIFTGWRLQELLSRLFSHVSKECQDVLLEVTRTFADGKISFEEYVLTLKNIVGINLLIEAVAIGKGKQDLTGTAIEPNNTNHIFSVRPETLMSKACSSLTCAEIIEVLTGNFRLSKAKSNDLFWEAVWPRLLARGWNSEQPKNHGISKSSLVFLIPEVKKFSRRKLVKGYHYFDSVSDVLNKVALEPELIELGTEENKGGGCEENKPSIKEDRDALSNKQWQRYLQPNSSKCNRLQMKFTIVDTSLVRGGGGSKVIEQRSLPTETSRIIASSRQSSESEPETSDESEETNTSNHAEEMTTKEAYADSSDCVMLTVPTTVAVENQEMHSTSQNEQKRKNLTKKLSHKVKSGRSKSVALVNNQQNSTASNPEESGCCADKNQNKDQSCCRSHLPEPCQDIALPTNPPENCSPSASCLDTLSTGKTETRKLFIDLNIPPASSDVRTDETTITDVIQNNDSSCANISLPPETTQQPEPNKNHDGVSSTIQQPAMNNRRQSTRNRPLTTKVLEAFACGFLSPVRKRKSAETAQNRSTSRRVLNRTGVGTSSSNFAGNVIADSSTENSSEGFCSNTNVVGHSHSGT